MRKRKKDRRIVVGLDVGTTKICVIVAEVFESNLTILTIKSSPSEGLRKGVVIDLEAVSRSIKNAIANAETETGSRIQDVIVGIAGSHIKSFNSIGTVGIRGKEVAHEDVERAIDAASAVYVPLDREILHVMPNDFILDGQGGIKDPVGMAGSRLEVKVYIVTGALTAVQNLLKCCDKAGLKVNDIVLQPLASAEATLTGEDRGMGIALVDVGGGTTDVAVYQDGWLRYVSVLGIGGNHFTNDVSVGLRLPFHEAERVKKEFGSLLPSELSRQGELEVVGMDSITRVIPRKYLLEILQPRGDELLELIHREIRSVSDNGIPVIGAVFTGGASLLPGFDRIAEVELSMPVRIGYPDTYTRGSAGGATKFHLLSGLPPEYNNPMYATGVGLILFRLHSVMPMQQQTADGFSPQATSKIIETMRRWFKRIRRGKQE